MNKVEMRKKIFSYIKNSKRDAKKAECVLCGKAQSSFCNSHTIPQFILRKIADMGKLTLANYSAFSDTELDGLLDYQDGVNKSITFQIICRECDSQVFQDYENEKSLLQPPSNKMMAEIALKNCLLLLAKRFSELELYKTLDVETYGMLFEDKLSVIESDIQGYSFSIKRSKKIIDKNLKSGFHVMYWEKLPYVVPFATQTPIVIHRDMDGKIVNDVYSQEPDMMQDLHFCVFPFDECTIVCLFYHKDDRKYVPFERKFNRMTHDEKLKYINYWIFKYTENYVMSPSAKTLIENDKEFKKLSQEVYDAPNFGFVPQLISHSYKQVDIDSITNLLSPQNALKK